MSVWGEGGSPISQNPPGHEWMGVATDVGAVLWLPARLQQLG